MTPPNAIVNQLLAKLAEQIQRTGHLMEAVPDDRIDWCPAGFTWPLGAVLGHLLDCMAGFCATLYALFPAPLAHFMRLRELPVNHCCDAMQARSRTREYLAHIEQGFALLSDDDLVRRVPTVFVPGGEPAFTLLLGNLEHLINHKHQLFVYLKLLGIPVSTPDLYRFRGDNGVNQG